MADNVSLDVLIRILTDSVGGDKAQQVLAAVRAETSRGTEANKEHAHSWIHLESNARQYHRILHQITETSPLLGLALRAALTPIGALLAGVVIGLKLLTKASEESQKAAEAHGKVAVEQFSALSSAAIEAGNDVMSADRAMIQQFRDLAEAQNSAAARTKDVIAAIQNEQKSIAAVMEAQEKFELAKAGNDEKEKVRIKQRFRDNKLDLDDNVKLLEVLQKEAQLKKEIATPEGVSKSELAARGVAAQQREGTKSALDARVAELTEKATAAQVKATPGPYNIGTILHDYLMTFVSSRTATTTPGFTVAEQNTAISDLAAKARELRTELDTTKKSLGKLADETNAANKALEIARKKDEERTARIAQLTKEIEEGKAAYGLSGATSASVKAYEHAANAIQNAPNTGQIALAASRGDVGGMSLAIAALASWPGVLHALLYQIQVTDRQVQEVRKEVGNMATRPSQKLLPGAP